MCSGPHPFIPFVNTAKVEVRALWDLQQVENVIYFKGAAPYDATSLAALGNLLITNWRAQILPLQAPAVVYSTIRLTAMHQAIAPQVELAFPSPNAGTRAGTVYPNNVTAALKLSSGLSGQSARGRLFHVGLTNGQAVNNRLNPADITAIINGYMTMRGNLVTAGHQLVVASYCHNGAWRIVGETFDVISMSLNAVLDSQRRRLPERGS